MMRCLVFSWSPLGPVSQTGRQCLKLIGEKLLPGKWALACHLVRLRLVFDKCLWLIQGRTRPFRWAPLPHVPTAQRLCGWQGSLTKRLSEPKNEAGKLGTQENLAEEGCAQPASSVLRERAALSWPTLVVSGSPCSERARGITRRQCRMWPQRGCEGRTLEGQVGSCQGGWGLLRQGGGCHTGPGSVSETPTWACRLIQLSRSRLRGEKPVESRLVGALSPSLPLPPTLPPSAASPQLLPHSLSLSTPLPRKSELSTPMHI